MNLSAPFIRRPVMTTLVMVAIIFFGVFSYCKLPVSDIPNIDYPTITVSARQPGGSPRYMADLVTLPLERNLMSVSGINSMTSSSSEGRTSITLNFELDVNLDEKEVEVQSAITRTLPELPPLPYNPTFDRFSPSDTPILFLMLSSDTATSADLYYYAQNILAQPISMINGVSDAEIYGLEYAMRVQVDPLRMASYSVDFNQMAQTLYHANPNQPAGKIRGDYDNFLIESDSQIGDPETYHRVIVKQDELTPLFVGDMAKAIPGTRSPNPFFKMYSDEGTQNIAIVGIKRLADSNTIAITKEIAKELPTLTKTIPGSIEVSTFFSAADQITHAFYDVEWTLLIALVLVVLVIFLYLGKFFEALIPSLVLPMSIIATLIFMYLFGFNLDFLSLLALTLSIGFVIDDAIVVMENVVRHIEMGQPPKEAALEGSKQISITVLTMSVALSAVFIPFVFMPGIVGRIMREFSVTIIVAIYCSGAIALMLNPVLCSKFLKTSLRKTDTLSHRFNEWFVAFYINLLHHSIRWKKSTILVATVTIIGSFFLYKGLHTDFFPASNLDLLQGLILYDEGSSKRHSNEMSNLVMNKLKEYPFVQKATVASGYPEGDDQARFYVKLKEHISRPSTSQIAYMLMRDLSQIPGADIFARPYPTINLQIGSDASLGDYQYMLFSLDSKRLYPAARAFIEQLYTLDELVGINHNMRENTPQLKVTIDRERAGFYQLSAMAIEKTLQFAYAGGRVTTFNRNNELYDLILEADPKYNLIADDLDLLYIKSDEGKMIPLSSVATWEETLGPASISHFNSFPSVNISFSLANGIHLSQALEKIEGIAKETLPDSIIASIQGSGKVFQGAFSAMGALTLIAIFVIYLLLGILYESFLHPITVLSSLPLALFGGLFTLIIFGQPLSLYGFVGLIVLIGLVQKNGIMLVDFAKAEMEEKKSPPFEAILAACHARFRPIMMTTIAAIAGALPIAIGVGKYGDGTRPLGLVIAGGLIFSQLVTLFVTPVTFLYIEQFRAWLKRSTEAHQDQ